MPRNDTHICVCVYIHIKPFVCVVCSILCAGFRWEVLPGGNGWFAPRESCTAMFCVSCWQSRSFPCAVESEKWFTHQPSSWYVVVLFWIVHRGLHLKWHLSDDITWIFCLCLSLSFSLLMPQLVLNVFGSQNKYKWRSWFRVFTYLQIISKAKMIKSNMFCPLTLTNISSWRLGSHAGSCWPLLRVSWGHRGVWE